MPTIEICILCAGGIHCTSLSLLLIGIGRSQSEHLGVASLCLLRYLVSLCCRSHWRIWDSHSPVDRQVILGPASNPTHSDHGAAPLQVLFTRKDERPLPGTLTVRTHNIPSSCHSGSCRAFSTRQEGSPNRLEWKAAALCSFMVISVESIQSQVNSGNGSS
jgi:hypothetical protein